MRTSRRDRGFTLPEVLIAVTIIAVIATVLVGVVSVVLRNTPSAEARADDARSVMGLVTWLPQDVDSTPPGGFDLNAAAASGCGTDTPGSTSLLRLQWTEAVSGTTTTYIANYRHESDGANARVVRVTCSGTGAPPYANRDQQNLTSELPALPPGWVPGQPPAAVTMAVDPVDGSTLVTMRLTTFDGDIVQTDSAPKNPAETLPSTTLPSWYPPTPTTLVYVNSLPTTTNLSFTAHPALAVAANLLVHDVDGDVLAVNIVPSSVPLGWVIGLSSLNLTVTPSVLDVGQTRTFSYTVDDQQGDGVVTGTVTVEVVALTTPTTTSTTTTTTSTTTTTTTLPACQVTGAAASPADPKNVQADSHNQGGGNVNVGVLNEPVTISATTNQYCNGLQIQYDSGGVNSPPFVNLNQTSATTWSASLPGRDQGSSETWSDGTHSLAFHDAAGGPYGAVTLTVK